MRQSSGALLLLVFLAVVTSCGSDPNPESSLSSGGGTSAGATTAGGANSSSTSAGGFGGASGAVGCPPGIPMISRWVGGSSSTEPISVCDNGQGTVKFGERCLKSADCVPGTFCYSSQCTAICGGNVLNTVGVVATGASCSELFGFAVCGARVQQRNAENSIFFCAPTCAKDADCSVGETCNETYAYTNMPSGLQQWYTAGTVCTVN